MAAGIYNIVCKRNSDLDLTFTMRSEAGPMDLTNFRAKMQVRPASRSTTIFLDLSTENGGIVLGTTNGTVRVYARAAALSSLRSASALYDLILLSPDGKTTSILEGTFTVESGITEVG